MYKEKIYTLKKYFGVQQISAAMPKLSIHIECSFKKGAPNNQ